MGKQGDVKSLDFLKDYDAVMCTINDTELSSRKIALASIVVALSAYGDKYDAVLKKYRDDTYSDAAEYNDKLVIEGQRKSEREDKNWTTPKRLKSVLARMKKDLQERGVFTRDELGRQEGNGDAPAVGRRDDLHRERQEPAAPERHLSRYTRTG